MKGLVGCAAAGVVTWMGLVAPGGSAFSDGQARLFTDFTARAGIAHRHLRFVADPRVPNIGALWGAVGGAAAAVGDFNGDGFDDIYVTSSREGSLNRLYRNNHGRSFTDVAEAAGVARVNTGHHATTDALWLDYDNDGALDLFVLRLGSNVLFRNTGGAFTDVTEAAGLGARRMNPFAAVAFDYDNDGDLDLLVGGYFPDEVDLFQVHTTRFLFDALDDARTAVPRFCTGTTATVRSRTPPRWPASSTPDGRSTSGTATTMGTAGRTCTLRTTSGPTGSCETTATAGSST